MVLGETQKPTALITGITGQDGSYLAELLVKKGYSVHGLARRNSSTDGLNTRNLSLVQNKIILHKGDILDFHCVATLIREVSPQEIYHLAAQSHVSQSFVAPEYTMQVNTIGTLNLLQAVVACGLEKHTKLYNAATSEMFGGTPELGSFINENTPFLPKSPYAVSKLSAYWLVRTYQASHGLWAVNGLLFNHESARRGSGFVTTRIARGVAAFALNRTDKPLTLANVNAARDWGHAKDYVHGIWSMLQQGHPCDMVLATGRQHTVQEFVEIAFGHVGVLIRWVHNHANEIIGAEDLATGKRVVQLDQGLQRKVEVRCLLGDSSLARNTLQWGPRISFEMLVAEMVDEQLEQLKKDK